MTSTNTLKAYQGAMNRLIRSAEIIARLANRPATTSDIGRALTIRAQLISKQSVSIEIYALRWFVKKLTSKGAPDQLNWGPGITIPEWLKAMDQDEWHAFMQCSMVSMTTIRAAAGEVIQAVQEEIARAGSEMNQAEMVDRIACVANLNNKAVKQKDLKPISQRELTIIDMATSLSDPYRAIHSLKSRGPIDIRGLTRLFSNVIWATGMRPVELWTCRMMVPRQDIPMTEERRETIRVNPRQAILNGDLIALEKATQSPTESLGSVVMAAIEQTGAAPVLVIRSAKQTNANPESRSELRIQVLAGISKHMATMIAVASQLRHLDIPPERQESARKMISVELKEIGRSEPSLKDFHLTLYAFRHSFATRVKRLYELPEAAALTGHSAIKSVYSYGKRQDKGAKGGLAIKGAWAPLPDKAHADMIRRAWSPTPTATPDQAPQAKAVD